MIRTVDSALLEVQHALLARSLYPPEHPRIGLGEARAHGMLNDILEQMPEITFFAVEGRVIFENEILPSSATLSDTLFHVLNLKGVDQVTFRRGLEQNEISRLLDCLAGTIDDGSWGLKASPHIGFGSLHAVNRQAPKAPSTLKSSVSEYAAEAAEVLPGIWGTVSEDRDLKPDQLGDIVSCLARAVAASASALIPLAPLKRHDEYTFVHTINVTILSISLAEALGFDNRATHELSIAALLHDIGKQAVPKSILNKDGLFTPAERRIMEIHPVEGARMLINTPGVPDLAPIVAFEHHIRPDGGGYPNVPRGWRLNLASRVVQLVDVFDALRTNRTYRPGLPLPRIVEVMKSEVGTFFDADLLQVFLQEVVSRGLPEPFA